jgi:oligopeptide transport system substrate-binding protein
MVNRWVTIFLSFLIVLAVACPSPALAQGVFNFPLFYVPTSLDPVEDKLVSTYHIFQQVYDGLVAFDSNLRVVPGLARSWTVSRDGKKYTFTLREGVKFHNGNTVTAADVTASLTRIIDPQNEASSNKLLDRVAGSADYREGRADSIRGISTVAGDQVVIELTEPYAPFLSVLAMPFTKIVPREMINNPDNPLGKVPVGTGPFRFDSWDENKIILKANSSYFQGAPNIDEIRFLFYPGETREKAFPDFLAGKLDGCPVPGSAEPGELRNQGYQVLVRPRMSVMFYGMNTRTAPLDDPQLRKALTRAFDRERYTREVLKSKHVPAHQIIPPGMPGYSPDNALLTYDPSAASRHLENSRYPEKGSVPELVIASASHSDAAKKELELFRLNLAELGIQVKPLFVESWEEFKAGIESGSYSLYRYALHADIPDPEDLIPELVETGAAHNFTGHSNLEIDAIFDAARKETDPVVRLSLYRKGEKKVLEDASLIPVIFISTQVAFQQNVQNVDLPATGTPYLPFHRIELIQAP